ncbi:MAG: serine acetyltransferase [Thermaerobacter sp.]|nr:serine acetyltransferase [Thermaerobacter sp.]
MISVQHLEQLAETVEQLEASDQTVGPANSAGGAVARHETSRLLQRLQCLLFPREHPYSECAGSPSRVARLELLGVVIWDLAHQIHHVTAHDCANAATACQELTRALDSATRLSQQLPAIQTTLWSDAQATFDGDPAARDVSEIIATYPGFYATMVYRLAHTLFQAGVPLLPRIMTELAHSQTGIDIHPGATIGSSFFIDHGTGVVIGETCLIGDRVTLYQGVTLGALNFPHDQDGQIIRGQKRHPTIGDDVVIYSGATILGGDTVIGQGSVVGGNVWLTQSIPAYSKVTNQPTIEMRARIRS